MFVKFLKLYENAFSLQIMIIIMQEFIRFTLFSLLIFISFSSIFTRKFCKFCCKKIYFIKNYVRNISQWNEKIMVVKLYRSHSQQSKISSLDIISHNQKLLSSPHWNPSLRINLIIPFSFSPLKLISPAGLRFRSARVLGACMFIRSLAISYYVRWS